MKTLEFFFDFGSPSSYLAHTQMPRLKAAHDVTIVYRPFLLGGVFRDTGNRSPALIPAKSNHMLTDLRRWARRYDVTLNMNPHFPVTTLTVMRGAAALESDPQLHAYMNACFSALWIDGLDLGRDEVITRTLDGAGFDTDALWPRIRSEEAKQRLRDNTEEAIDRGAFGAPTFFIGHRMYFGQDRLDFVAEALAKP